MIVSKIEKLKNKRHLGRCYAIFESATITCKQ